MNIFGCFFGHKWSDWDIVEYDDDIVHMTCKALLDYIPAKHTRTCKRCGEALVYDFRPEGRDWSTREIGVIGPSFSFKVAK